MLLLTAEEVAGVVYRAGWRDTQVHFDAVRIAFAESVDDEYVLQGGKLVRVVSQPAPWPKAGGFKMCDAHMIGVNTNGTRDRGLLQVNSIWTNLSDSDAMDPDKCAAFAYKNIWLPNETKRSGSGFTPWAAWNNKTYQNYYAEAAEGIGAWLLHSKGRPFNGLAKATGGI
jgi:hypothetical protein